MKHYARRRRRIPLLPLLILLLCAVVLCAVFLHRQNAPATVPGTQTTDTVGTDAPLPPVTDPEPQYDVNRVREVLLAREEFRELEFSAKYISVFDVTTGAILFEKNANSMLYAASTTKLLTALTALDHVSKDTVFTVGSELSLVGKGSSTAGLKQGQKLTTEQILDAMLIPSGNDAAYVIAVQVGRNLSEDPETPDKECLDRFLKKMNEKAASLGATSSLFTCPDGFPGGSQHTTAADMMKIAAAAYADPQIAASCRKIYAEYPLNDGSTLKLTTTNQLLLPSSKYYYEGAVGLKTGFTNAAGQCIIGVAETNGHTVIAAIYNAPTDAKRWIDCRAALNAAFDAIEKAQSEKKDSIPWWAAERTG